MIKHKLHKNGAMVTFQRNPINGFYTVAVYSPNFTLYDKVSCDTYRTAVEYRRLFNAIAQNYF